MVAVSGRPGFALAGLVAAVVLAAPVAAQSFLDSYKAGVAAAETGEWEEVESAMRTAVAGRPEEANRLPLQLHFKPYLPHFFLGRALAERGACREALESFAESERQGVIQKLADEHALLRGRKAACEERLAAEAATRQREDVAGELIARARRAVAGAEELVPDAESEPDLARAWEAGEPSLATRLAEARGLLQDAERALAEARRGEGEPDGAADLARGTLTQVEAVVREAALRKQAVADERDRAVERLADVRRAARELLGASAELAAEVAAVGRRRAVLEGLLRETADSGSRQTLAELDGISGRIEREMAHLRGMAQAPPKALLEAAEAWLRGEPEAVFTALGGALPTADADAPPALRLREPRARAHALLLRAAAAFALYHAGGGQEPEMLEAARRDAAECRRTDPSVEPVARAFSPRFRAFFEQAGQTGDRAGD